MAPPTTRVRPPGTSNQVSTPKSNISSGVKAEKPVIIPRRDPSEFAWKHCDQDKAPERLRIKEDAVFQAFQRADEAADHLEHMFESANAKAENDTTYNVTDVYDSIPDIQNWLRQLDEAKKRHSSFRVLVGFGGATGVGKTSAINSILGHRNLLPSSNEEAATAVPCVIEYNRNERYAFRAKIIFRERKDIEQDIDGCIETLSQRIARAKIREEEEFELYNAQVGGNSQVGGDEEIDEEDIDEALEMISLIFGLDEHELHHETRESVLSRNPAAQRLLDTTLRINANDAGPFADRIRPYMDSVEGEHFGREFLAWPLIKEVRIFVRSDVLKNGTVLVDLPGLADTMKSRSAVTENYRRNLDILAVVLPITRARNEQTGVQLMTDHQTLCMQMDGKYNKNSISVILSKTDDIDVAVFLNRHREAANKDLTLQDCLARHKFSKAEYTELDGEKKGLEAAIARVGKDLDVSGLGRRTRKKLQDEKVEKDAELNEIGNQMRKTEARVKQVEGQILHWCIRRRNQSVQKDIQHDFNKRQQKIRSKSNRKDLYDGNVSMFPISASMFWKIQDDIKTPIGFPSMNYTGIPALTHWLRYATAPAREKHLDAILNTLESLLNLMNAWSCNTKLHLTNAFVETQVMHLPLDMLQKALKNVFGGITESIKQLDPMKNKDTVLGNTKQKCVDVVTRWSAKDASRPAVKGNKLAWSTYHACVRKKGEPHRSRAAGKPRYAWIETLCNLFYEGVVNEWNAALSEELPALKAPALDAIDNVWAKFLGQLEAAVKVTAPEAWPFFEKELQSFVQIKEVVKDAVTAKFDNLSANAGKIHRNVTALVHHKMDPAFKHAANNHGKGMYERQRAELIAQAHLRGNFMFQDSVVDIDAQLRKSFDSSKKEFEAIIVDALRRVKQHVRMMLDERLKAERSTGIQTHATYGLLADIQRAVGMVMSEWQAQWRIGDYVDLTVEDNCHAIPEEYFEGTDDDDATDSSNSASVIDVDALED